ncbi:MAG: hypothetical protein COV57_00115 [Candidatus Liptonbacteria bacterium CG11_big_fil_rev_8_21_14_0_20_35_14]|uniref:Uncharacterized protein n=1 Tax=Candidatus Liptonbacteria bacterium CG11_big_fil_rev_8_21_14_0_20_35_14 TaxID=1974634 RepID=A0A2H0NAS0_9BACT|nr:MAG: hypothetical protein COV57_00115 [Candidatus Liptonbacteria bacterium CG11_big_fil_rev_8_21_14_0_20_35_14]
MTSSFLKIFSIRRAAATLPVVLILGGIILEITAVSSFVAFSVNRSGLGERAQIEALSAAKSGAEDAIRRLIRNKDFSDAGGYILTVGNETVNVVVTKDVPEVGKTRIEATSTVFLRQRVIRADVSVDATTGQVNVVSFQEVRL